MSNEIRIAFVDGHADVWRLFRRPAQLREIAESCGAQLVGIATVVTELSPEAARGLAKLHALVRR